MTRFLVRFRMLTGKVEHEAEIISRSPESLIIATEMKLHVGERLTRIQVRRPTDGPFCESDFNGRVVCGDKLADGRFGYQIEIEGQPFRAALEQS